jgi:prepilin-type processing-associated H-X9-DG protein
MPVSSRVRRLERNKHHMSGYSMKNVCSRIRAGMTLTELLVVMGVVSCLFSMLMPAIQQAREAARRTQCKSNLKQIGVALQAYESTHCYFPGSVAIVSVDSQGAVNITSYTTQFVQLLPFLDQSAVYNNYDFNLPWFMQSSVVAASTVAVFNCPAVSGPNPADVRRYRAVYQEQGLHVFDTGVAATSDYLLVKGSNSVWCFGSQRRFDQVGLFDIDWIVRLSNLTDGASTTFAIGEGAGGERWKVCTGTDCTDPEPDGESRLALIMASINTASLIRNRVFPAAVGPYGSTDETANKNPITQTVYDDAPGANDRNCGTNASVSMKTMTTSNFRSNHSGGLQFLFADGHVQFINEHVDTVLYRGMSTIGGSELAN